MLKWGVVFMAVGCLSFLLPIFGRQFGVVTLFGFTGMGSAGAGIVFFAVGLLLFIIARKRESHNLASQIAALQQQRRAEPLKRESLFADGADGTVITEKAFVFANAGDVKVQALIGSAYLAGSNGLPQDPRKAAQYPLKAAEQGDGFASLVVAGLFAEGLGVAQDFDNARIWATRAKTLGVADADQMLIAIDSKRNA